MTTAKGETITIPKELVLQLLGCKKKAALLLICDYWGVGMDDLSPDQSKLVFFVERMAYKDTGGVRKTIHQLKKTSGAKDKVHIIEDVVEENVEELVDEESADEDC